MGMSEEGLQETACAKKGADTAEGKRAYPAKWPRCAHYPPGFSRSGAHIMLLGQGGGQCCRLQGPSLRSVSIAFTDLFTDGDQDGDQTACFFCD